jgi:hypothetical protein
MTLIEHQLYRNIKTTECIQNRWQSKGKSEKAPNIQKLIQQFNRMSSWVINEILEVEDLKLRAVTLNRFIFIAEVISLFSVF